MKITGLQRYGSLFVVLAVAASFSLFPSPHCFDCEPMYNWGLSDAVALRNAHIAGVCLFGVPLLCAILGMRRAWFVPIVITIADIATQHLAGVPWWDVWNNEGPIIAAVDIMVGFASLGVGFLIYFVGHRLLNKKQMSSTMWEQHPN